MKTYAARQTNDGYYAEGNTALDYTDEELLEMGIPEEMISERINIQMYDEIIVH